MINWLEVVSYSLCGAMLVMMAIDIAFSAFMPALDRWSRCYFITLFSLLMLYVVVIFIDVIIYNHPEMAAVQKAVFIFEYMFFSVMMPMPMPFLLHCCGESEKSSVPLRAVMMLWVIFCLILFAAQFTDAFYYVEPDNQYIRGTWFPLLIAPLVVIMILNIQSLIRRRKKLSKRVFIALLIYLLPTAVMIITYMFVAVDMFVAFWMGLCALTMFSLILMDNVEQYMLQQREIANQRASVMVLQMRPHFIYNTLMSIYCLCNQDPQKARQVTMDFTNYLRKNFNAVASDSAIPFTAELEHTRAYLSVEQVQYEELLIVEYDTPFTRFRLPPLTLQPLVENAVKHGMDPYAGPLHILIRTRHTDAGSVITVEDNGPGFDPAEDSEPHIALTNIRQRLEMMCGGKLEVTLRNGGGTTVTMTIPDRHAEG
ncbi:MAG: histidine kinase [Clostridia bacterium]|nr:histidine kinase [Clostridia bacterium]